MKISKLAGLLLALMLLVTPAFAQDAAQTPEEICAANVPAEDPETRQFELPEDVLEADVDYQAVFCTSAGAVYADLYENYAPMTVNSFVFLAQQGYYNNSIFHRVMADFMAQGGDPVGSPAGTGGPGYQFNDEPVGFLVFDRPGLLAMANAGTDPATGAGTNGSQFFITTALTDWLNYKHTIFGEVLTGYDNVTAIQLCDPDCTGVTPTTLDTVVIITDPATVSAEIETIAPATAEELTAALQPLTDPASMPEDIQVVEEVTGTFTTDEVVAAGSADAAETYAAYLADYGHEFRVRLAVNNASCNVQYFFSTISYAIDAFDSADNAAAALADERLDEINAAEGFTRGESVTPFYTKEASDCSGAATTQARLYLQRGRYAVVIEAVLPQEVVDSAPLDAFLSSNVSQLFEQFLSTAYRSEVR